MKNLSIYIGILLLLGACNPLEKMVDSGQYDKAVITAARKMAGDKHKKTKHVKALEEAFAKATRDDLAAARSYADRGGKSHLLALSIYEDIADRQAIVAPYLPLVSKDGYTAEFRFVNTEQLIADARTEVGFYYYETGKDLLMIARDGDKAKARSAFEAFGNVNRYMPAPSDLSILKDEAYYLGVTHVYVNLRNEAQVYMPARFEQAILEISVADLNSTWKRYYLTAPGGQEIDVNATLIVEHINISPEREYRDLFEENKRVKDGWEYKRNKHGKPMLDTLGNKIKIEKFVNAHAKVTRVKREKGLQIAGTIRYTDAATGEPIRVQPVKVENRFLNTACRVLGDPRALSTETKNCSNSVLGPFPTDHEMAMEAAYEMKGALKGDLDAYLY